MTDGFVLRYDDMDLEGNGTTSFTVIMIGNWRRQEVCFVLDYLFEDKQEEGKSSDLVKWLTLPLITFS